MSMTETVHERQTSAIEASPSQPSLSLPRSDTPIVPRGTISGRALTAVIAIMTFLASLTTGAVTLVWTAAGEWRAEVAREVTIQIRPVAGRDIEADIVKAAAMARNFPGVAEVRPYSREEAMRLLEPWLGAGAGLDELPVPRIIVVKLAPAASADFGRLRRALVEQIPAATLDDHRGFLERMRAVAGAAIAGGLGVLLLVLTATVLSVSFATRAAMATNRPVIEVLHLIGAKDKFIAGHFQRHFLRLGFKGGLIGGASALALFALAELARGHLTGSAEGEQFAALFGSFSIGALGYAAVLAQVALIALVTAATSRRTVSRTVETMY
ncbi:MAG TPA: ABC transporter permease [Xanthobacteraceae bacterium]